MDDSARTPTIVLHENKTCITSSVARSSNSILVVGMQFDAELLGVLRQTQSVNVQTIQRLA